MCPSLQGNPVCGFPKPWLLPLCALLCYLTWARGSQDFKVATVTLCRIVSPQPTPGMSPAVFLMLTAALPHYR